ncbi:MAG TPA: hypothetical protein ENG60_02280 [Thermoplasmatales archaeon]|nr:hypothetical protein [Thermoplasmatales archaeon]HEX17225.1 hypothetical protein [Thermoplasmatales archaeon]
MRDATGVFECTRYKGAVNVSVKIKKPSRGYLYIFGRQIIPTVLGNTLIIGPITIEADARGEVSRVEFYVDNSLRSTDYDEPYSWHWDEFAMGWHEIKVVAYDNSGKEGEDKISVVIFNWCRI